MKDKVLKATFKKIINFKDQFHFKWLANHFCQNLCHVLRFLLSETLELNYFKHLLYFSFPFLIILKIQKFLMQAYGNFYQKKVMLQVGICYFYFLIFHRVVLFHYGSPTEDFIFQYLLKIWLWTLSLLSNHVHWQSVTY